MKIRPKPIYVTQHTAFSFAELKRSVARAHLAMAYCKQSSDSRQGRWRYYDNFSATYHGIASKLLAQTFRFGSKEITCRIWMRNSDDADIRLWIRFRAVIVYHSHFRKSPFPFAIIFIITISLLLCNQKVSVSSMWCICSVAAPFTIPQAVMRCTDFACTRKWDFLISLLTLFFLVLLVGLAQEVHRSLSLWNYFRFNWHLREWCESSFINIFSSKTIFIRIISATKLNRIFLGKIYLAESLAIQFFFSRFLTGIITLARDRLRMLVG